MAKRRTMGVREYARHRGVRHSSVQAAIKTRRIQLEPDGRIDARKADRLWAAATDLEKPRNTIAGTDGAATGHTAPTGHQLDYLKSRARLAALRCQREELEDRVRAGELIELATVEAWVRNRERTLRQALMSIPNRLGQRITVDARRLVTEEIKQLCDELARGPQTPPAT